MFKYLGVVFTSDQSRNKGLDIWIGKANSVLRELYCSVVTKRELTMTAKLLQFLNRSLFRSSPVVMNLSWRLKAYCQKNKWQRWDICEELLVWQTAQFWNLQNPGCQATSTNRKIPAMLVQPCIQNVPGKNGELIPLGYSLHPWQSDPEFIRWPGVWLHLQPSLVPSWCGASRTISNCCWSWGILGHPRVAAPQHSPKEKLAQKWANEWVCRPTLNLSIYEIVFGLFANVSVVFK